MRDCPLCSSGRIVKIATLTGSRTGSKIPLYACRTCFTVFQESSYQEDDEALKRDLGWHVRRKEQGEAHSKSIIEKLLEISPSAKTMLDIGCGIGSNLLQGSKLGLTCSGIEPNPFAVEYARQHHNLEIIEDYFSPEYFSDGFDLIILDQVLEHVSKPQQLIKGVLSVLKPSGLLYLGVPANTGGVVRVIFSIFFQRSKFSMFRDEVHINHFFDRGIRYLGHTNGANIVCKVRNGNYILQKK